MVVGDVDGGGKTLVDVSSCDNGVMSARLGRRKNGGGDQRRGRGGR